MYSGPNQRASELVACHCHGRTTNCLRGSGNPKDVTHKGNPKRRHPKAKQQKNARLLITRLNDRCDVAKVPTIFEARTSTTFF